MPDPAEASQELQPLQGVTPDFRAIYSFNVDFTVGADQPAPSAKDSIFVQQPEITEALEAVALNDSSQEDLPDQAPLDVELALDGLKIIRKTGQFKQDPPHFKKGVVRTRNKLKDELKAQDSPGTLGIIPEAKAGNPSDERRIQQADEILDNDLKEIGLRAISIANLTDVLDQVGLDSDGHVFISDPEAYQAGLEKLSRKALRDPKFCLNLYGTMALIIGNNVAEYGMDSPQREALSNAFEDFKDNFSSLQVDPREINRVTPKWFQLMEEISGDTDHYRESTPDFVALSRDAPEEEKQNTKKILLLEASILWAAVVSNNITSHAKSNPFQALDTLYSVAQSGLDPEHHSKFSLANSILKIVLKRSKDLRGLLILAPDLNDDQRFIAHRANDLRQTIDLCGWGGILGGNGTYIIPITQFTERLQESVRKNGLSPAEATKRQKEFSRMAGDDRLIFTRILKHGNPLQRPFVPEA